jgi:hypothetical protein
MAGCYNSTAGPIWDLPTSNAATPTCVTGSNVQKGVLTFANGQSAQMSVLLPPTISGNFDVKLVWSGSGTGTWVLYAVCTAADGTAPDDPPFGAAWWTPAQDTAAGLNVLKTTAGALAYPGSCSGGKYLHLNLTWSAGTSASFNADSLQIVMRP